MRTEKITRNSFKNNYLKEIVMRLDFQGVLQVEMEDILLLVKKYLKEASFNRYEESIGNEIEINVGPNAFKVKDSIREVSQMKIYTFSNEDSGISFKLSTKFIVLKVNVARYVRFEEYSKLFIDICNIYKEKIDFFTAKRLGFRKINFCFLKSIESLNKYFEGKYYNCFDLFEGAETKSSIKTTNINCGSSSLNIAYVIEQGQVETDVVYKVLLDSDVYSESIDEIQRLIFDERDVCELNDKLFLVYVDSITTEMGEILKKDISDIPNEILGVDSNE